MSNVSDLEYIYNKSQIGCKVLDLEEAPLIPQPPPVPVFYPAALPVPSAVFSATFPTRKRKGPPVSSVSFPTPHPPVPAESPGPFSIDSFITSVPKKEKLEESIEDPVPEHLASAYFSELRAHGLDPAEVVEE